MQNDANSSSTQSHQTLAPGQKLAGCYVLAREIPSESGLSVWLAQDEVLGKDVTLHFVPAEILGDTRAMAELRQEVKRNRQLIHPNILRVYDFVEDGGYAAISMDILEGESLSKRLKDNGMFEPSEIRGWFKELAGTLDDAHRVQLFHRDLSPSNIYVRPGGGIVVTNFGVSRTVKEGLERARTVAPESLHMSYMSPQQLDGEKPSKSDDVYGLGVLAFQLLSSSVPFSGPEIVTAIRATPAPRISDFRGGAVPEEWESFAEACLAKKAEHRPPTCCAALAILDGAGTDTAPAIPRESVAAAVTEREESVVGVMAGAATVMGAGLGSGGSGSRSAGAERRVSFGGALDEPLSSPVRQEVEQVATASAASAKAESSDKPSVSKSSQFPPPPPSAGKGTPALKSNLPANFPQLSRPNSKLPFVIVGSIAAAVAFLVFKKLNPPENMDGDPAASMAVEKVGAGTVDGAVDPKSVASSAQPASGVPLPDPGAETPAENAVPSELPKPDESEPTGLDKPPGELIAVSAEAGQPPADPAVKPPKPVPKKPAIIGENPQITNPPHAPVDPKAVATPTAPVEAPKPPDVAVTSDKVVAGLSVKIPTLPIAPPKLQIPSDADAAALERLLAERVQSEAAFKEASVAAERALQDTSRLAEASKKAQEILRKSMEDRKKALTPVLKENDALLAEQKKREVEAQRAEAAAMEARKAADSAKAALETLAEQSASKLEAVKKADDELKQLAQEVAAQARQADDLGKTQTQIASLRQQAGLGLQQIEREKALLSSTIEKAKNAAAEAMRAQNQTKIAELLKQARPFEAEIKKANDVLAQLKELGDAGVAASKPISERLATSSAELKKLQDEISKLGGAGAPPSPLPKNPPHSPPAKSSSTNSENGANSLGMEFIRIGDVDFSKNLVTRRDYEGFAVEKGLKGGAWRSPGFVQNPDHPVVNVTWKEADAFCKWLTDRELKSGALSPNESYRLPTDLEWSHAVGLSSEQGLTPEERDLGVDGVFPWGLDWPPPQGAGNYAGEETESEVRLQGYRDEYQWTSPVGAFKPNKFGLNDMGGNVWQWTSDYFNGARDRRVLRGGSWYNGGMKQALLSSCRYGAKPDESNDTYGFRVVKTHDATKTGANQK